MCQDCHGTGLDDGWGDDGYEADPDDDWYDDRDDYEPDPEDAEIARGYAEHYEHCEQVHGGGGCYCGPSLLDRIRWRISGWRRRLDMKRHPDRYDDMPPF